MESSGEFKRGIPQRENEEFMSKPREGNEKDVGGPDEEAKVKNIDRTEAEAEEEPHFDTGDGSVVT